MPGDPGEDNPHAGGRSGSGGGGKPPKGGILTNPEESSGSSTALPSGNAPHPVPSAPSGASASSLVDNVGAFASPPVGTFSSSEPAIASPLESSTTPAPSGPVDYVDEDSDDLQTKATSSGGDWRGKRKRANQPQSSGKKISPAAKKTKGKKATFKTKDYSLRSKGKPITIVDFLTPKRKQMQSNEANEPEGPSEQSAAPSGSMGIRKEAQQTEDFPPLSQFNQIVNTSKNVNINKRNMNAESKTSHSISDSEDDSDKDELPPDANQVLDDLEDEEVQKLAEKVHGANLSNDKEPNSKMSKVSYRDIASKAKTAKKMNENFLLYVQSSSDQRLPLPKKDWLRINQVLTDKILSNFMTGGPLIETNWTGFTQNRGIVACKDQASYDWVKATVADLKFKDKRFKAWGRYEFGDKILAQTWVNEKFAAFGADRLLAVLVMAGKLKGKASVLSYAKAGGSGHMLKLLGDKEFALSIMQNGPIRLPTGDKIELALPKSFVTGHRTSSATATGPAPSTSGAPPTTTTTAPTMAPQRAPSMTASSKPSHVSTTPGPTNTPTTSAPTHRTASQGSSNSPAPSHTNDGKTGKSKGSKGKNLEASGRPRESSSSRSARSGSSSRRKGSSSSKDSKGT